MIGFVCKPCRENDHTRCFGWCDCQHRRPKNLGKISSNLLTTVPFACYDLTRSNGKGKGTGKMSAYKQLGMAVGHTEIQDDSVEDVIRRIKIYEAKHAVPVNVRQFCNEASTPSELQWLGNDVY